MENLLSLNPSLRSESSDDRYERSPSEDQSIEAWISRLLELKAISESGQISENQLVRDEAAIMNKMYYLIIQN